MGVKIIHDENNLLNMWIHLIHKIFNLLGPIHSCAALSDAGVMPTGKRLKERKDAACSVTKIFRVNFLLSPGRIAQDSLASPRSW